MWYKGQKVVCVKASYNCACGCPNTKKDEVYTIRTIEFASGLIGFTFEEISSGKHRGFLSDNFRPLLTDSIEFAEETLERIKTNIEIEIEEPILN